MKILQGGRRRAASRRERNARDRKCDRATSRLFRSARRNAGYNLIDLARGGGILQVLKTTAHQTAMLARPRFTCLCSVARANRRAARDVTRLYRRMNVAHVTQQHAANPAGRVRRVSRSACLGDVVHSLRRSVIVVPGRPRPRPRRHRRRRRGHGGRARSNPHALRLSIP